MKSEKQIKDEIEKLNEYIKKMEPRYPLIGQEVRKTIGVLEFVLRDE